MMFPKNWEKFIEDYSFKDSEEVYTNGTNLVPVFRVEQMVEHYFNNAWIPVSERLPEVGTGDVLVARSYKGKPYVDVGEFINGTACCWGDGYAINPREHITTHWMPLPNPPEGECQ
jgi:hypothetical protein